MFNDLCEKFPDFNKTQSCYITKKPYYTKPVPKQETKRVVLANKIVRKPVESESESESDSDNESGNESDTSVADGDTFRRILEGLNPKRWEHFDSWLKISFIIVNEKQPIDLFHELSKKYCPQKFDKDANERIIRNHKPLGGGYSIATLYLWLKEDNNSLFKELQASRRDIWKILYEMNHSDLAKLYYNLNPNKYIRSAITGWYEYNTYNVLESFGQSAPSSLLSSVTDTLQTYITEQRGFCLPKGKDDKEYDEKMKIFKKAYMTFGTAPYIQNVMKYLTELYTVNKICINDVWASINDLFDSKTNLLAFDDKVYDIEKKAFRDITPTDYITMTTKYRAPTKSNANMRKRITELLNSIFGDKEILNYWLTTTSLGMFCGSKFESLYVHTGSGGNGKGVLSSYLERALGDYFLVAENTFLTTSFKAGAPNPTLAKSKGVRMLLVSEPDDGKEGKLNVDFVKAMTGGDSITARDMYKSTITFKPQFTCMLQCNNKPQFSKIDGGIARRVKVIHYPFRFVDTPNPENVREKQKDSSLKDEAQRQDFINEFMLLLLEHASANYSIKNIAMPSDVKESTQDYMNENNHIKAWLESNIVLSKSEKDRIKADELYKDYKNFDEGEGAVKVSTVIFAREMDFNNIEKKKSGGVQYYLRIKFKEDVDKNTCNITSDDIYLKEKDL